MDPLSILIFILVLSILVFVHEFGHFIVAKLSGVKVEEFGIGFPPKVLSFKSGGTVYSLNLIPFGGFVRLYGEEVPQEAGENNKSKKGTGLMESRTFYARPTWQKAAIVVAGATMNFLLAVVLFSVVYSIVGVPETTNKQVMVTYVFPDTPAEKAGIQTRDRVLSIGDTNIITVAQMQEIIRNSPNKPLSITLLRSDLEPLVSGLVEKGEGRRVSIMVTPQQKNPDEKPAIGIGLGEVVILKNKQMPLPQMIVQGTGYGLTSSLQWGKETVLSIGKIFSSLFGEKKLPEEVAGPVGIYQMSGLICSEGPLPCMEFIALLSVNLAVLNVLPLSPLDGGKLFFISIEALLRGRAQKLRLKLEKGALIIGTVLLLMFILAVTRQDILRILNQ